MKMRATESDSRGSMATYLLQAVQLGAGSEDSVAGIRRFKTAVKGSSREWPSEGPGNLA